MPNIKNDPTSFYGTFCLPRS